MDEVKITRITEAAKVEDACKQSIATMGIRTFSTVPTTREGQVVDFALMRAKLYEATQELEEAIKS